MNLSKCCSCSIYFLKTFFPINATHSKFIYQDKSLISGKYGTEDGGEECDGDDDGFRNPVKSEIACEAYSLTAYSNPLNPDSFPGIRNGPLLKTMTSRMITKNV